jgi:excisionase family DNA binding protein
MPRKPITTARIDEPEDFVGTKEAALILGVSISTVQKLVDSGVIRAWRTNGGHRRLALASLKQAAIGLSGDTSGPRVRASATASRQVRALVVEDNAIVAKAIAKSLSAYEPRLVASYAKDAAEALLMCAEIQPDLIITDLVMEPFDGFHLVRVIRSSERLRHVTIVVVTGLSAKEVIDHGGLDADILVYRKPLSSERLCGFLDGFLSRSH